MNKKYFCYFLILFFVFAVYAKPGDSMYVNVEKAVLKEGTSFFSAVTGNLSYGTQVKVLVENGKWVQIVSNKDKNLKGWISLSSLTKKKIILKNGLNSVSVSADELALAGKGFSAEVENLYKNEATSEIYDLLDSIENRKIDNKELLVFIKEGGLLGADE